MGKETNEISFKHQHSETIVRLKQMEPGLGEHRRIGGVMGRTFCPQRMILKGIPRKRATTRRTDSENQEPEYMLQKLWIKLRNKNVLPEIE